tara:strand:+ start:1226 stop:2173 length:948 start_codon:yes stop_codon:yes gene_type:complete
LVEQWPFKPFVTGSNPVRPKIMKILLTLFLLFFTTISFSETTEIYLDSTYLKKNLLINADHYSNSRENKTVAISIHGTRGFKSMEVISVLSDNLLDLDIDTIAPNISYGINDRENEFLSCDIEHLHNRYANIDEIIRWFIFAIEKDYQDIILIGHSRGGQDIIQAYNRILKVYPEESKKISSIVLLAPLGDNLDEINISIQKSHSTTIRELMDKDDNEFVKINFLNCNNATVKISSFLSYYNLSYHEQLVPMLTDINIDTYVFTASEDTFVPKTHTKVSQIKNDNINLLQIDGADHFFRDLFLDDVVDNLSNFIE